MKDVKATAVIATVTKHLAEADNVGSMIQLIYKGTVAIIALARLDELTMTPKWHDSPKVRKKIRLIINTANNDMLKMDKKSDV